VPTIVSTNISTSVPTTKSVHGDVLLTGKVVTVTTTICLGRLMSFRDSAEDFMRCSINYSRPLQYCFFCVKYFDIAKNTFESFKEENPDTGSTCEKEILASDEIQTALQVWNFIDKLWFDAQCEWCFKKGKTRVKRKLTKDAKQFYDLSSEIYRCYDANKNNKKIACKACREKYLEANTYYNELSTHHKLCADLIDSMNYTRYIWGHDFHCFESVKGNAVSVGVLASIIFLFPVILYMGLYVNVKEEEKKAKRYKLASQNS